MTTKDLPTRVPPLSRRPLFFLVIGKMDEENRWGGMEEIPHQLIGAFSHYLQGFFTSSINSISMVKQTPQFLKLIHPKPTAGSHGYIPIFAFTRWWLNQPIWKYVREVGS